MPTRTVISLDERTASSRSRKKGAHGLTGIIVVLVIAGSLAVGADALPVVLVYGFQPLPGYRAAQLWERLAETISGNEMSQLLPLHVSSGHEFYHLPAVGDAYRDVFLSNVGIPFEPTWRDIFVYVDRFAQEMAVLRTSFGIDTCHVVAHSMGGLIVRAYIEGDEHLRAMSPVEHWEYRDSIHTLVMLATPNHGVQVAAVGEWFSVLGAQLRPGSSFLCALNAQRWVHGRLTAIHPGVRYVSIAAQSCLGCGLRLDREACKEACVQEGLAWEGSDLVVMMASAYLPGAEHCALMGFDHSSILRDQAVAELVERILCGERVPAWVFAPSLSIYEPSP